MIYINGDVDHSQCLFTMTFLKMVWVEILMNTQVICEHLDYSLTQTFKSNVLDKAMFHFWIGIWTNSYIYFIMIYIVHMQDFVFSFVNRNQMILISKEFTLMKFYTIQWLWGSGDSVVKALGYWLELWARPSTLNYSVVYRFKCSSDKSISQISKMWKK